MSKRLGLVLGSTVGPPQLAETAATAERAGFDELWLSEDFFFTGGIGGASIALGATERIRVGLGVVSAVVRHPALLAMELSTVAGAYPDRFLPGIGLGVPDWMRQMDLMPDSPLTAVRESVTTVKRLLAGETVSERGEVFASRDVSLTYPPRTLLPVHMGVIGPKMLELSGEIADGSILSVGAGTDYVRWARDRIEAGRRKASRVEPHGMTAFTVYAVDHDRSKARDAVRRTLAFYKAAGGRNALTDVAGISDDLVDMVERGGADAVAREMPDSWVDELAVAGTPDEVVEKLGRLHEAGADSVALVPAQPERLSETIELTTREVLPRL